jgi:hypothetical protein
MEAIVKKYMTIFPIVYQFGDLKWYKDGKRHRDGDEPAWILPGGTKKWYKDGKLHREGDEPAVIWADKLEWWKDGKRHRDGDKPAVIGAQGTGMRWEKVNGEEGRIVSIEALIVQEWWKEGKKHRDDGKPAVIWSNSIEERWIDGKRVPNPSRLLQVADIAC